MSRDPRARVMHVLQLAKELFVASADHYADRDLPQAIAACFRAAEAFEVAAEQYEAASEKETS